MTHSLSEEQQQRAQALNVAHRLLCGYSSKGALTSPSVGALLPDELPALLHIAQYVLTGDHPDLEDLTPATDAEELETIAGATGSAYIDTSDPGASAASDSTEEGGR